MDINNIILPKGTILQGEGFRYQIQKVLGHGSFGITYQATMFTRTKSDEGMVEGTLDVAIKEFFMEDLNGREGMRVRPIIESLSKSRKNLQVCFKE